MVNTNQKQAFEFECTSIENHSIVWIDILKRSTVILACSKSTRLRVLPHFSMFLQLQQANSYRCLGSFLNGTGITEYQI